MDITIAYSGYCPQNQERRRIYIDLAEVSFIGALTPEYKKMSFQCPDGEYCQHLDSYGRCPLFVESPDHP